MRIPNVEHTSRRWRIHEIAPDFEIEDVWSYRTPGATQHDFAAMLDALRAAGGLNENPAAVRLLFAVRWKLGAVFGWDRPRQGLAGRVETLLERLPDDLRQEGAGLPVPNTPFTMVYELPDECAIELANKTVHDILHLGWVPTEHGEYELRMAALVKPNGMFGRLYLAGIKPFRYLIVYPALTQKWERAWRNRHRYRGFSADASPTAAPGRVRPKGRKGRGSPLVKIAAGLLVFGGVVHLAVNLREVAPQHARAWLGRELWRTTSLADMSPANGAFWLTIGSWAMPQILLGLTLLWLDQRDITPPAFLLGMLAVYAVALGLFTPQATAYGALIIGMLMLAKRLETNRIADRIANQAG